MLDYISVGDLLVLEDPKKAGKDLLSEEEIILYIAKTNAILQRLEKRECQRAMQNRSSFFSKTYLIS